MALMKWKPFVDMERFFDDEYSSFPLIHKLGWDLAVDVYEKNGNVIAEMSLPGVDPEKIDVVVENDYLRISGSREEEKESEDKNFYSKEIKRGSFERAVTLPTAVKGDKAEAKYNNGILKVVIPKKDSQEGQIKVKVKA